MGIENSWQANNAADSAAAKVREEEAKKRIAELKARKDAEFDTEIEGVLGNIEEHDEQKAA